MVYLAMYTRGILLFFGRSAKRLFLSCSRASLKYWSISWIYFLDFLSSFNQFGFEVGEG